MLDETILPEVEQHLQKSMSADDLMRIIEPKIEYMIERDFGALLRMLYQIDVSEKKVKQVLEDTSEKASVLISYLIIERLGEKLKTRKAYSSEPNTEWDFDC